MRKKAARAYFGALLGIPEIAAAFISERVQRAVAEQTVEIFRLRCFVAGEILAFQILKERKALSFPVVAV